MTTEPQNAILVQAHVLQQAAILDIISMAQRAIQMTRITVVQKVNPVQCHTAPRNAISAQAHVVEFYAILIIIFHLLAQAVQPIQIPNVAAYAKIVRVWVVDIAVENVVVALVFQRDVRAVMNLSTTVHV